MIYKVFIVDDEQLIREGLSQDIPWNEIGFTVSGTAQNGQEALACIERNVPHVIITDIKMPVMDGLELCKIVKQHYSGIKLIVLSGYGEFEYAQKAIQYNVNSYMLKPLIEEDLIQLLKKIRNELMIQDTISQSAMYINNSIGRRDEMIDFTFLKLINGRNINYTQCENELMSAGFEIKDTYFYAIAFSLDNDNDEKVDFNDILHLSKEYCRSFDYRVLYMDGIFYIILHSKSKISRKEQNFFADGFKRYIENKLKPVCNGDNALISIGVGSTAGTIAKLKDSVCEAGIALNYKFYAGEGKIIIYEAIKPDIAANSNNTEIESAICEIISVMTNNSFDQLMPKSQKLMAALLALNILDRNKLYLRCVMIYTSIIVEIQKKFIFIRKMEEDELYTRISRHKTFANLKEEFLNILLELKDQIVYYNQTSDRLQLINKVKKYISKNYSDSLSLDKISSEFFISSSYLSRIFKEETNENLSDYITDIRMENAKRLLETTDTKIQDISKQSGYADYRYFCTAFKKVYGVSPLQYRIKSS